jgi:hypothetical protein
MYLRRALARCFLDVSSLNLAALSGAATFFPRSLRLRTHCGHPKLPPSRRSTAAKTDALRLVPPVTRC